MAARRASGKQVVFSALVLGVIVSRQILSKWEPPDLPPRPRPVQPPDPDPDPARWLPAELSSPAVSTAAAGDQTSWLPDPQPPSVTIQPARSDLPRLGTTRRRLGPPAAALGTAVCAAFASLVADGLLASTGHPVQGVATAQAPPSPQGARAALHRATRRHATVRSVGRRYVSSSTSTTPTVAAAVTLSTRGAASPSAPQRPASAPVPAAHSPSPVSSSGVKAASPGAAGSPATSVSTSSSSQTTSSGGGSGSPVQTIVSTVQNTVASAPSTVQTVVTTATSAVPPAPTVP